MNATIPPSALRPDADGGFGVENETEDKSPSEEPEVDAVLSLTTEVLPAKRIEIDEEPYDLYSYDHLSPEKEARVTATFARFQKVYRSMESAKTDEIATGLAMKLEKLRVRLICLMTSIPEVTAKRYPNSVQGKIVEAIGAEITGEADGGSEED